MDSKYNDGESLRIFCDEFGVMLFSFYYYFRVMLGSLWGHVKVLLGSFWAVPEPSWKVFGPPKGI